MNLLAAVALLCAVAMAQAQGFVATMSGYGEYPGYLRLVEEPGVGPVWEFDIKGREGMFKILEQIHQDDYQQYEVRWGARDTLRVRAVTHSPTTGKPFDFELMLRFVLNDTGMTYRIEGGLYNIVPRPEGLPHPDWTVPAPRASTSLDHIARALSLQGRGYRVDRVAGREVSLLAPFASWDQLLWIVSELDPGIKIVDDGSVVEISKRGH